MEALQTRVLGAWPSWMAKTPSRLLQSLKNKLVKAYNGGQLKVGHNKIHECVQLDPRGDEDNEVRAAPGKHVIVGGIKDFHRNPASARLIRNDGAWLHFTILVEWDGNETLKLLAYDFELVFPEGHNPPFIRFDLNPPGHPNEAREIRSHAHPGTDDTGFQLPAPVMTPEELLDLLVWDLRPRDPEKPRA